MKAEHFGIAFAWFLFGFALGCLVTSPRSDFGTPTPAYFHAPVAPRP